MANSEDPDEMWQNAAFHKSSLFDKINMFSLFDLILYIPVNNFSVMSGQPSWVEPVLSKDKCFLLKDTTQ